MFTFQATIQANSGFSGTTHTFSGVSIGAAAADRWVVVAVATRNLTDPSFSGCTIGGIAASEIVKYHNADFGSFPFATAIYAANVSAGATADIVLTLTSTPGAFIRGGVYTGSNIENIDFGSSYSNSAITLDTVADGGAIGVVSNADNEGDIWVGLTDDNTDYYEYDTSGCASVATSLGTLNINFPATRYQFTSISAASFGPAGGGGATNRRRRFLMAAG